jgi:hypothetical protein
MLVNYWKMVTKHLAPELQKCEWARHWWLTLIILASWETEIRRIMFKTSLGKS